jgi:hypothetical protein
MATMKKTHVAQAVLVVGGGTFPIDMLRYDSCIPFSEQDSFAIDREGRRAVALRRFSQDGGAVPSNVQARWQSYGWRFVGLFSVERFQCDRAALIESAERRE